MLTLSSLSNTGVGYGMLHVQGSVVCGSALCPMAPLISGLGCQGGTGQAAEGAADLSFTALRTISMHGALHEYV